MKDILDIRLDECNLSKKQIINYVSDITKINVLDIVVYTSHLEGLGTKESDFDIYVLTDNGDCLGNDANFKPLTICHVINDTTLDIEIWQHSRILNIINKIDNLEVHTNNLALLKLIHRLNVGESILNPHNSKRYKEMIKGSKIQEKVFGIFTISSNSELDDAIKMYKAEEYICALNSVRKAVEYAAGALNTKYGYTNMNTKWISKIFINNNGHEGMFLERYLKLHIFNSVDNDNIAKTVAHLIELAQDMLSASLF